MERTLESHELDAGTRVDAYVIERTLGRGGMATVYLVRQVELGSLHALKVLDLPSRPIRERLKQEGRLQASLMHPNIVKVERYVVYDGCPGLILEYVDGPDLAQLLAMRKLDLRQVDSLAQGILRGVRAAHRKGMVHRDLKPSNVLLARTEEGMVAKISDFGMAKVFDVESSAGAVTKTGQPLGTPQYMAPEQFKGAKEADQHADIWSLGCIFYEILAGRPVVQGEDLYAIYEQVSRGEITPLATVVEGLPERMLRAIDGCLVVDPSQRIPDVDTLLAVWNGSVEDWRHDDLPIEQDTWSERLAPRSSPGDEPTEPLNRGLHADVPYPVPPDSREAGFHEEATQLLAQTTTGDLEAIDLTVSDEEWRRYQNAASQGAPSTLGHERRHVAPASAPSSRTRVFLFGGALAFVGASLAAVLGLAVAVAVWSGPTRTDLAAAEGLNAAVLHIGHVAETRGTDIEPALALAIQEKVERALQAVPGAEVQAFTGSLEPPPNPGAIGLDRVVRATVGRLGGRLVLNVEAFEPERGAWARRASAVADDPEAVINRVDALVARVLADAPLDATPAELDIEPLIDDELSECHRQASEHRPALDGQVVVEWSVDPSGHARSARITENSTGERSPFDCFTSRLEGALFPAGSEVDRSRTFTFEAKRAVASKPAPSPSPPPTPPAPTPAAVDPAPESVTTESPPAPSRLQVSLSGGGQVTIRSTSGQTHQGCTDAGGCEVTPGTYRIAYDTGDGPTTFDVLVGPSTLKQVRCTAALSICTEKK